MSKTLIVAAVIALVPLGGALAHSAFEPAHPQERIKPYAFYVSDPTAKAREEARQFEQFLEQEHIRAHLNGFDGKVGHREYHDKMERVKEDWYQDHCHALRAC